MIDPYLMNVILFPLAAAGMWFIGPILRNKIYHRRGYIRVKQEQHNKTFKTYYIKPKVNEFQIKEKSIGGEIIRYPYNDSMDYHAMEKLIYTTYYDRNKQQIKLHKDIDEKDKVQIMDTEHSAYVAFLEGKKASEKEDKLMRMAIFVAAGGSVIAVIALIQVLNKLAEMSVV